MHKVMVKTHLIITDIHEEYQMNWCGKLIDAQPQLNENGLPVFIIVGSNGRVEMSTVDMTELEDCAKRLTHPKGREAVCSDSSYIYLKEQKGQRLMGILFHKRVKTFAPMYDEVYWK